MGPRASRAARAAQPHQREAAMNREEEEYVPQRFFPQQVGILLQRLAAAPPPWGAAPEAARVQAGPAPDALARALAAVPPLPAALLIEHKGATQWLRYAHACAALLPWQHYWTSAEKPLVRDLV